MKATPGPWIVSADGCAGDRTFRFLVAGPHFGPGEKAQAVDDARLIAASPTLYAFVKKLSDSGNAVAKETLDLLGLSD